MRHKKLVLATIALLSAGMVAVGITQPIPGRAAVRPEAGVAELAAWLRDHPTDWVGFSRLSAAALESDLPRRIELWRGAYEQAAALAPSRPQPATSFVRSGLFHWQELSPADRRYVMEAATPLLRDAAVFSRTHESLFAVTGDFALLLRNNPGTADSFLTLARLAVRHGRFAEYVVAREEATARRKREFDAVASSRTPAELIALLPWPIYAEHLPQVHRLLAELHRRPIESTPPRADFTSGLIEFAIRHKLAPLDGLQYVVHDPAAASAPARARLAIALGQLDQAAEIRRSVTTPAPGEWREYHLEKAVAHSVAGQHASAKQELGSAAEEVSPELLATALLVANAEGDVAAAALYQRRLDALSAPRWSGSCGVDLCTRVTATIHRRSAGVLELTLSPADGAADTYVEVRVNDRRVAEGIVDGRTWEVPVERGMQRLEVTVMNAGGQRRVRMS